MREKHERLKLLKDKTMETTRDATDIGEKSYILQYFITL